MNFKKHKKLIKNRCCNLIDSIIMDQNIPNMKTYVLQAKEIDHKTAEAWAELEHRSLQPNAYLSPYFVLPALKYLNTECNTRIILVEKQSFGKALLIGVGIFRNVQSNRQFPFSHQETYQSCHSFCCGLLIDREHAAVALQSFFAYFRRCKSQRFGIVFKNLNVSDSFFEIMSEVAGNDGFEWYEFDRVNRAILIPKEAGGKYLKERLADRYKDSQRRWRLLEKLGRTSWRITDGSKPNFPVAIERFIELEHMGWKGKVGSSLFAKCGHAEFFRKMATEFLLKQRAFFTELVVEEQVISSTFNLISGKAGFAFKVAYDPHFAKMSPGILNELELIRHAPIHFGQLDYVDSGAQPGSYLDEIWDKKHVYVSGVFTTSFIAKKYLSLVGLMRVCKAQLQNLMS